MLLVAENNVWICSLNNSGQIQSFASDGVTAPLYSERRELVGITEGTGSTSSPSNPTKARQAWECGDSCSYREKSRPNLLLIGCWEEAPGEQGVVVRGRE